MKRHLIISKLILVILISGLSIMTTNQSAQAAPTDAGYAYYVPVLMYHYISAPPPGSDANRAILSVTPDHFAAQMKWLKDNGYTTLKPDDLLSTHPIPKKSVLVTIDDGYIDAYTNAFPVLKSLGFTGTFFIVTDWVDQNRPGYVNWGQVKEMAGAGMAIEAHSRTHENMRGQTLDWLTNQIVGSMDAIEDHIGVRPHFFAYPYGSYDSNTLKIARSAGLLGAFTTASGFYSRSTARLQIPRLRVRGTSTVAEIALLVMRAG